MSSRFFTLAAAALTGLVYLSSCGDSAPTDDANLIGFNNYESVMGWMDAPGSLTRERAHSGHYSVKVDGSNEYAMGYMLPLGKATPRKPHKIRISGWAFMSDANSKAKMALQIADATNGQQKFSDDIAFVDQVKTPGKWVEISKDVTIPDNATSADMLKVFMWRADATSPAFLDDLSISLVE